MTGDNQTEGLEGSVGVMSDTLGLTIRQHRRDAGITQRDLADRVGVDFTYISKIENSRCGTPPSEALIRRIAEELHIDATNLLLLSQRLANVTIGEWGELQEQARHYQERAEKAEAEVLDIRTKSTALFKVMDRQMDEADEVAKRAEERVVVLTEALERYGRHKVACLSLLPDPRGLECSCGLDLALAALHEHEHEHAAQATKDRLIAHVKAGLAELEPILGTFNSSGWTEAHQQRLDALTALVQAAQATPDATGQGEGVEE